MTAIAQTDPLTGQGAYRDYLARTARSLYAAARTEQTLVLDDVDLALSGRRALLDLLVAVHADVTGLAPSNTIPLRAFDIEAHPVEALGRALRRYPRPPGDLAPTDVALAQPAGPCGAAWQHVARNAAVAHHAWTAGVGQQPDYDEQWTAIADVASLADTLTRLDVGLVVVTATDPGRRPLTSCLRGGLSQALGVAARESLRLAARGPLPDSGPDRIPLPALRVLPVRTPADLPAAQEQLNALLQHGGLLRPERFPALAAMHARACLLLAESLTRTSPFHDDDHPRLDIAAVRAALRRHARSLQRPPCAPGASPASSPGTPGPSGRPVRSTAVCSSHRTPSPSTGPCSPASSTASPAPRAPSPRPAPVRCRAGTGSSPTTATR